MTDPAPARHFIQQIIDADIASGKWGAPGDRSVVATRFPPEPNGYLHIGHAKSVCLNTGLAAEYGGRFYLRPNDSAANYHDLSFSIHSDVNPDAFNTNSGTIGSSGKTNSLPLSSVHRCSHEIPARLVKLSGNRYASSFIDSSSVTNLYPRLTNIAARSSKYSALIEFAWSSSVWLMGRPSVLIDWRSQ